MDIKLSVRRFDPDTPDPKPYYQEYDLEVARSATVLGHPDSCTGGGRRDPGAPVLVPQRHMRLLRDEG